MQYTIETWGEAQAETYRRKLTEGFQLIQENPLVGRAGDDILPHYRVLPVEKHLIIYWPAADVIVVVRILHVNRDITRHL